MQNLRPGSSNDFASSIVLLVLSVFVLHQGVLIHADAGVALAVSPGLLSLFLGSCLLLCTIILFARTLKGQSVSLLAIAVNGAVKHWFRAKESDAYRVLGGIVILGLYVFVLIPVFEFWLSSTLFLVALMLFLRAASPVKIGLLTVGTVGGVIVLFQILFNVTLP